MKRILILIALILSMSGCVSTAARDATAAAIDEADKQVRLKWSEEWKPALIAEAKNLAKDAKDNAVQSALNQLEQYKKENEGKLEKIGVKVDNFDTNNDGRVTGAETLALLKDIREKNEKNGNPLSWWEIMLAVAGAYIPLTGAKEIARKKTGTGNGGVKPV